MLPTPDDFFIVIERGEQFHTKLLDKHLYASGTDVWCYFLCAKS